MRMKEFIREATRPHRGSRPADRGRSWLVGAILGTGLASLAAIHPSAALAAVTQVDALQMPAWFVRDGKRRVLTPRVELQPGDQVLTGNRARLRLRMPEGSFVKLGENAVFEIERLAEPEVSGGAFQGFLNVLKGAFRFTTTVLSRPHRRNLDIRVAGVTAGIRGTDLWGKAAPDRDIVCLIEGRIEVQRGEDAPFEMNEPLSFYIAPKGQPALPVAPVDPDQLRRWAEETEVQASEGVLQEDGGWTLNLASYRRESDAERHQARLTEAGYAAELAPATVDGQAWIRVRVSGLSAFAGARSLAESLEAQGLTRSAWVQRAQ